MSSRGTNQDLFSVRSETRDHAVHLRLSGELDVATSPVLDGWLSRAGSNGYSAMVLDLEGLTFIDATGLRSLHRAAVRARRSGKGFAIVNVPRVVRRVLDLTGTAEHLEEAAGIVGHAPGSFSPGRSLTPR
jgi:anti-sigma B factor antagonist